MVQIVILIGAVLALMASVWKVYDTGGDHREADVRAEHARAAEADRQQRERHEREMRDWALQLARGFLRFGAQQDQWLKGVKDDLAEEIRRSPALQRVCLGADGVLRFNRIGTEPASGTSQPPGARDGSLHGGDAGAAGKPAGRIGDSR